MYLERVSSCLELYTSGESQSAFVSANIRIKYESDITYAYSIVFVDLEESVIQEVRNGTYRE
jgi:hypothetical protein